MKRYNITAKILGCAVGAALAFGSMTGVAMAKEKHVGTYNDWNVFSFTENGAKVCYMASIPKKDEGNYTRRGDIFAVITHRPAANSFDVVSIVAGYTYKPGSEVTLRVGDNRFNLFTEGENAWARDAQTDKKISNAIKAGSSMVVQGTSSRGTLTTDTYSLSGSTAAYNAMNKECGVSR